METNNGVSYRKNKYFDNEEKFIKNILFTSVSIVGNDEYIKYGMNNRNIMFFLNSLTDKLGSISMLGNRIQGISLLGNLNNIISYYNSLIELSDGKDKTIPKDKIDYIKKLITNSKILSSKEKITYTNFFDTNNDKNFIENIKLIYNSLIENKYFENVSDHLYELVSNNEFNFNKCNEIDIYIEEYISLLIDYVGISIFEIKKVIRDTYRAFFNKKSQDIFLDIFSSFASSYQNDNQYFIGIQMDKEYDEKLLHTLKNSKSDKYTLYSKSGLIGKLNSEKINNKTILTKIISELEEENKKNYYYIFANLAERDVWKCIKSFKQNILQPYLGSMLYSGIRVKSVGKYIIVEYNDRNNKKFINKYSFYDDVFKPLSQDRIAYSEIFKRYIIKQKTNKVNEVIDEAVQLLPYYRNSESILTKFSNTWFALETLFRNADSSISRALSDCASYLVADRLISGYIYVTATQIKRLYAFNNYEKMSNNFVENIFMNYKKNNDISCDFLEWKYNKIIKIIDEYDTVFNNKLAYSKELLDNAYRMRNKQFHGKKDNQLESISGFLYDIVNDTISFYIDYLDVYKDNNCTFDSLYNIIKNINKIKKCSLENSKNEFEKISVLYDSVRKI